MAPKVILPRPWAPMAVSLGGERRAADPARTGAAVPKAEAVRQTAAAAHRPRQRRPGAHPDRSRARLLPPRSAVSGWSSARSASPGQPAKLGLANLVTNMRRLAWLEPGRRQSDHGGGTGSPAMRPEHQAHRRASASDPPPRCSPQITSTARLFEVSGCLARSRDLKRSSTRSPTSVEVLSPSSGTRDTGAKLAHYLRVASLRHYLIVRTDRPRLIHHRRGDADLLETRIVTAGTLKLDPPVITLEIEQIYG
jgi:hypothetical protein